MGSRWYIICAHTWGRQKNGVIIYTWNNATESDGQLAQLLFQRVYASYDTRENVNGYKWYAINYKCN